MKKYDDIVFDSWSSFKESVAMDVCKKDGFPYKKFIFRGQADADWGLVSSFDRTFADMPFHLKQKLQQDLIGNFKKSCRQFESLNLENYSDIEIMSLGQHYGLPTRLLDWSYSIYIAAFFAYTSFSVQSSSVAIWAIDTTHEIWQGEYGVSICQDMIDRNSRQMQQFAVFTMNRSPDKSIESYVETCSKEHDVQGALYKILIPISERRVALNDLDMMGITHCTLLGGIDGCAQTALVQEYLKETFNI